MNASSNNIWRVPGYLPYLQEDLSDRIVAEAEKTIGYSLPESFLALLRVQNGGYIAFSLEDTPHSQIYGIGSEFPSLTDFDWEDDQEYVSFQLEGLVPFDGDGHWHLCLDYRSSIVPKVSYVDIECDEERVVAESFEQYLALLRVDVEDGNFVIPNVSCIEDVISKLSDYLGVVFDPPDSWAHGYPQYRASGGENTGEWIWISPNTVSRGFVREEDSRYQELKDRLPGLADIYPGLPESSYILSTTDGIKASVLKAFASCSIGVQSLSDLINEST